LELRIQEMETVVVTGARGFLGRHASLAASQRGARVIAIGHGVWTDEAAQAWGLSAWHDLDVTCEALTLHAESPSFIVHCAGSGSARLALEHPARDFGRTVVTTVEVLEYIRTRSPWTALVYPSSGAVYGNAENLPVREDASLEPVSPYGAHKKVTEDLIRSYGRNFGLRAAIVRVFSVYGAELRKQLLWDACQKAMRGEFAFSGTGTETRDWVAVEDVAELLLIAADHAATEAPAVNCATGLEITIGDTLAVLFASLGLCQQPIFAGSGGSVDLKRYAGDPSRALAWGWEPKWKWTDGMAEYARWFLCSR
jgi:UDP-glucose 4-epimerase